MYKIILLSILLFCSLEADKTRIALVIGNNNYQHASKLSNPISDTNLISKQLEKLDFDVIHVNDATLSDMKHALELFRSKLSKNSVGLFYFAGHGIEMDGKNYLIPIETIFDELKELRYTTLDVDTVVRLFKDTKNDMNIIILDACRENPSPFIRSTGLATFTHPDGLFVAYAAQAGTLAFDGKDGLNSPFATAFVNNLQKENIDIESLFKNVRSDVYQMTNGQQRPSTYSEILTPFIFNNGSHEKTRALKVKEVSTENHKDSIAFKRHKRYIEPSMVLIKAGTFVKGSEEEFESAPAHEVNIEKDFYIATHELTFEEYDLYCDDTNWKKPNDNGWGRGKQPVINVSWEDATRYTEWLSKKTGKQYRLPTESEWEYVARDKTTKRYGVTDDEALLQTYAWFDDSIIQKHAYMIGLKRPNNYGVYDILGNVAEWTSDSFNRYKEADYNMGKNLLQEKVIRGGDWKGGAEELYVYKRVPLFFRERNNATGFRIVMVKE